MFKPVLAPHLPSNLKWYLEEPTWRAVATGRLKHGMKDFSLELNYSEDYGVNASLTVAAGKAGYDLGGKFQSHKETSWTISGKFG
jgi:hypothetical protein